jgi:CRISPR/Cas system-associated exonuclease Cas4 (RecB family)
LPPASPDHIKRLAELKQEVSYSRLSAFETCRYRWWLSYVEGIKNSQWKEEGELGTELHRYAEALLKGLSYEPAAPLSQFREWTFLAKQLEELVESVPPLEVREIERFHSHELPNSGVRVIGRIDLVWVDEEGIGYIPDWKGGRSFPKDIKDWQQGLWYSWMVFQSYPEVEKILTWPVPLRPELKPLDPLEITRENAEVFDILLRGRVARYLREEDYPADTGRQCYTCPFVLRCEKGQEFVQPFLKLGDKEVKAILEVAPDCAVDVFKAVQFLRATATQLSEILKEHVSRTQPLDLGGGVVYGPRRKVVNKYGPPVGEKISYVVDVHDVNEGEISDDLVEKLNG